MKVTKLEYFKKKRRFNLWIEIKNENYGLMITEVHVHLKTDMSVHLTNLSLLENRIPKEEHIELMKEIRNNEEFKNFARQQVRDYFEENEKENIEALKVESVFVLRTKTNYIREVVRYGPNLSKIDEIRSEEHLLYLAIKFKGIEEEIHMDLVYERKNKYEQVYLYRIHIVKKHLEFIENYLTFNWEEQVMEQVIPIVKERVNFLLP